MLLIETILLSVEVSEIIKLSPPKPWDNVSFLTDLYIKKGYSLRRISRELGCSKTTVRKKLREAGVEFLKCELDKNKALKRKVEKLRARGLSYQKIAELFNLWKLETKSGEGWWHAKTIRGSMD